VAHRGERVEGEQRVAILDQALDRLVVFDGPSFDEGVERRKRILLGLGHPDFQCTKPDRRAGLFRYIPLYDVRDFYRLCFSKGAA
jgi:hypothetical protein